jgi:hypothetical protein
MLAAVHCLTNHQVACIHTPIHTPGLFSACLLLCLCSGHPHPESHARPWDPPDTDLTFSPKISAKSQAMMAESRGAGGNGGFLARLDNDLKRRQVKIKVVSFNILSVCM